jgi:hypothetical protein
VRPGYYRIDATDLTGPMVSAYTDTNSGAFAIVAVNTNATLSISETFTLTNVTLASPSLTPWITSLSQNATNNQPAVTVSGSSFSYTLPAMSVVTLVGTTASKGAPWLSVSSAGPDEPLVFSWPSVAGYTLQTNGTLQPRNWVNYGGPITATNGTNSLSIALPAGNLFFRLSNP